MVDRCGYATTKTIYLVTYITYLFTYLFIYLFISFVRSLR